VQGLAPCVTDNKEDWQVFDLPFVLSKNISKIKDKRNDS